VLFMNATAFLASFESLSVTDSVNRGMVTHEDVGQPVQLVVLNTKNLKKREKKEKKNGAAKGVLIKGS